MVQESLPYSVWMRKADESAFGVFAGVSFPTLQEAMAFAHRKQEVNPTALLQVREVTPTTFAVHPLTPSGQEG